MSSAANPLLRVQGLELAFGGVRALTEVTLEIQPSEIFGVLGPNGAGKTSLLNVLSGYYRPTAGAVELEGRSIAGWAPAALCELGVGRTFQNVALFGGLTVRENVLVGRHRLGAGGFLRDLLPLTGRARRRERVSREAVEGLLRRFELHRVADEPVRRLPYGLRKRVDLARALAGEPRLLLLDEPLAGTTAGERRELGALLLQFWRDGGLTIVVIEHDAPFVADVADNIAVLDFGRLIAEGAPEVVLADQAVVDAYLGPNAEARP